MKSYYIRSYLNADWYYIWRLSWSATLKLRAHKHIASAIFALLHMGKETCCAYAFILPHVRMSFFYIPLNDKSPLNERAFVVYLASGNDLLSHGETPHYHRRNCVSLLSSEWDQVEPQCYGFQTCSYWLILRLTVLFPRYYAHVLEYTARLARHGFVSQTISCVINLKYVNLKSCFRR